MTSDKPKEWYKYLPKAEWWYNTRYHTASKKTLCEMVYNQPPHLYLPYLHGKATDVVVDKEYARKREEMVNTLKSNLAQDQLRMKTKADKKRSERVFSVGD